MSKDVANVNWQARSMHCRVVFCLLTIAAVSSAPAVFAQIGTATLDGTVLDPSNAVVANASVVLENVEQKFARRTQSNSGGLFTLASIPPGSYTLTVTAAGFAAEKFENLTLSSGQAASLNVQLRIGQTSSEVVVSTTAPLLQTANGTVGSTIEQQQVRELPLIGRNYSSLLLTLPGVSPVRPADGSSNTLPGIPSVNPSVYGQRQRANNFMIDSGSNNDFWFDDPLIFPPPEAIAEVKVESGNTSSAAGKGAGASINVVSKSGGDQYRGDAWYLARNAALNARSFFTPTISAFRWNQFGGTIGGPIVSKKTRWYFFAYYEGIRRQQNSGYTALVPTQAQIGGNFSGGTTIYNPFSPTTSGTVARVPFPNNQIPANLLNATDQKIAQKAYPTPNVQPGQIPGVNYINEGILTNDQDQFSVRADHQFGHADNFFARYTQNTIRPATLTLPGLGYEQDQLMKTLLASDTHIFSPTMLVTVRYGLSRRNRTRAIGSLGIASDLGLLPYFPAADSDGKPLNALPKLTFTGYTGISESLAMPAPSTQNYVDGTGAKTAGRHTLEFGGTVYHYHHTSGNAAQGSAAFNSLSTASLAGAGGDGFASFLLGIPTTASRRTGNASAILTQYAYSLYVQDNYRVTTRLTLNVGLRWDYAQPMFNQLGSGGFYWQEGIYYWNLKNPVTGAAPNVPQGVFPPHKKNFAPRVGLAYRLTNSDVIRASYGIFYDVFDATSQSQQAASGNWPFSYVESQSNLNNPSVNNGIPTALMPNPFPGSPQISAQPLGIGNQSVNPDPTSTRTPYTQQWSFSAQHQFSGTMGLEAVYFGSHSLAQTGQLLENIAPTPGSTPLAQRLIYPTLTVGFVSNYNNYFQAWYDGLSIKFDKRLSHGVTFQANYTWSKTLDYVDSMGENDGSQPTRWNANRFKGPAGFDIPQRLVFSYIYEEPFTSQSRALNAVLAHWSIAGITQFDSGLPYGVWISQDWANTGSSGRPYQFPNLVGDPTLGNPTPRQWFNTSAFALPQRYGITGDAGRNILRADGLVNWDFSLFKTWYFNERRNIETRVDAFDLFNQTTFGNPGFLIDVPSTFGAVSTTRNSGRSLQVQARFHF